MESFAGVADPLTLRPLAPGEHVVDLGSGAGFDCFVAAAWVGAAGRVVGVDMTPEMIDKARATAQQLGLANVEFREGLIEDVPVEDGWADVVMSNGVLNLVVDKPRAMCEIFRALRPGGALAFADIAVGRAVPDEVARNIDLWTDCIAGGQSLDAWRRLMQDAGFVDVGAGPAVDTFGGARVRGTRWAFEVMAHAFLGRKPAELAGLVGRVISVDEVGVWKPAPTPYLHAAGALGVEPHQLAMVAVHAWDVHGAVRAGLVGQVGVPPRGHLSADVRSAGRQWRRPHRRGRRPAGAAGRLTSVVVRLQMCACPDRGHAVAHGSGPGSVPAAAITRRLRKWPQPMPCCGSSSGGRSRWRARGACRRRRHATRSRPWWTPVRACRGRRRPR